MAKSKKEKIKKTRYKRTLDCYAIKLNGRIGKISLLKNMPDFDGHW